MKAAAAVESAHKLATASGFSSAQGERKASTFSGRCAVSRTENAECTHPEIDRDEFQGAPTQKAVDLPLARLSTYRAAAAHEAHILVGIDAGRAIQKRS